MVVGSLEWEGVCTFSFAELICVWQREKGMYNNHSLAVYHGAPTVCKTHKQQLKVQRFGVNR